MAKVVIEIERVSNGYVIIANGGEKAVAKDKKDVGSYFSDLLMGSIDAIQGGQIATLEINAKIEDKNSLPT